MPGPSNEILLVTPVWNDSARLAVYGEILARALADSPLPIRWMIADDGSTGNEHTRLAELKTSFSRVFPHVDLHYAAHHHGKGSVIREAWALAPDADWLAFVDADGSVTAEDLLGLIGTAVNIGTSVMGIRKRTATTRVIESPLRGLAHRGFMMVADLLLNLPCEDPQCGAKVFKATDYRRIAPQLAEKGLAFDSELLATLKRSGATWREIPVNWTEKKGGKVKPFRDGWRMLASLLRIRRSIRSKIALSNHDDP